jgi:hypothetical protein
VQHGVSKDGGRLRALLPSFETLAEFIIGPRFARTRWQAPQDEDGDSFTKPAAPQFESGRARLPCYGGFLNPLIPHHLTQASGETP